MAFGDNPDLSIAQDVIQKIKDQNPRSWQQILLACLVEDENGAGMLKVMVGGSDPDGGGFLPAKAAGSRVIDANAGDPGNTTDDAFGVSLTFHGLNGTLAGQPVGDQSVHNFYHTGKLGQIAYEVPDTAGEEGAPRVEINYII